MFDTDTLPATFDNPTRSAILFPTGLFRRPHKAFSDKRFPFRFAGHGGKAFPAMQCTEKLEDSATILNLAGEVDLQHSPELRKILQEKVKAKCAALVIDFSGVEYIDSSGLATLVEYRRDSQKYGGQFCLASLSTRVRTIFELVRLNEIIPIHATLGDALASLKPKT
jgi:anti-sigma B factor antagonist